MALGDDRVAVLGMMLKHGMSLAFEGVAVGLILTHGADKAMQAPFPEGSSDLRDPLEYEVWTAALLGVTLLAAYLPARRAARIEPTRALRTE
jgi:putative ABC transport system permease protein